VVSPSEPLPLSRLRRASWRRAAALALAACAFPLLLQLVGPELGEDDPPFAKASAAWPASSARGPGPAEAPETPPTSADLPTRSAPPERLAQTATLAPASSGVSLVSFRGRVGGPKGKPVAGVRVGLSNSDAAGEGLSDAEGSFYVDVGVSPHLGWTLTLVPPLETDLVARQEEVQRTNHLGLHDLGELRVEQGWSVSGLVVDPAGRPQAGVEVALQDRSHDLDRSLRSGSITIGFEHAPNPETGEPEVNLRVFEPNTLLARTKSRPDGTFRLRAVADKAQVLVARRGRGRAWLDLWPQAHTQDVRLVVDKGFELEVSVRDEEGRPVPGATVIAFGVEGERAEALSDAEGSARLEPLTGNCCQVSVRAPGHLLQLATIRRRAHALTRATLTLAKQGVLRGRCAAAGQIWARPRDGGTYVPAARDDQGSDEDTPTPFQIDELEPGVYDLLLQTPTTWGVLAERVQVRAGETPDLGDLSVELLRPLRVRVLTPEGEPAIGATLQALSSLPAPKTDSAGRCELTLPPGEHRYTLWEPKNLDIQRAPILVKTSFLLSPPTSADQEELILRARPARAHLRISTPPAGSPSEAPHVVVLREEGSSLERVCEVTRVGPVLVPLAQPGRHRVILDGYAMGTFDVPEGGLIEVPFETYLAPVEVLVLDAAGQPLVGLEAAVDRPSEGFVSAPLNARGEAWTDHKGRVQTRQRLGQGQREVVLTLVRKGQELTYRLPVHGGRVQETLRLQPLTPRQLSLHVPSGEPGEVVRIEPLAAPAGVSQSAPLDARRRATFPALTPGTYRALLGERVFQDDLSVSEGAAPLQLTLQGRGTGSAP
jgi:protocatechuate 3,4-dioxygenase beta subunit